jgi:arylsulfatase A-like enzyme
MDLEKFGWTTSAPLGQAHHRKVSEKGTTADDNFDPSCTRYQSSEGYNDSLHYGVTELSAKERGQFEAAELGADFITNADQSTPWCCCVSLYGPNEAMIVGRDAYEKYDVDAIPVPPNVRDDLSDRPNLYQRQQALWRDVTDHQWQQALACYYGRITEIDEQFGLLLDALDASGQAENTIIIITADHGKYVGGHGFEAHNFGAFEEIYNIPMIVSGPGIATDVAVDARVSLQDICPTILDAAGAEMIDVPDSTSFLPLVQDPNTQRDAFQKGYGEYHGTRFNLTQRIAYDGPWKFVFNGFDFDELYDLENDPYEMTNLVDEPAHAERVREMTLQMWERVMSTKDTPLMNTNYYSMRFAAIGPNALTESHYHRN